MNASPVKSLENQNEKPHPCAFSRAGCFPEARPNARNPDRDPDEKRGAGPDRRAQVAKVPRQEIQAEQEYSALEGWIHAHGWWRTYEAFGAEVPRRIGGGSRRANKVKRLQGFDKQTAKGLPFDSNAGYWTESL